jgi:hypothetical protein
MNADDLRCMLRHLEMMSPRQRRSFFALATLKQIRVMEEACYNLVKNKKLSSKQLTALAKKHGSSIKVIARRKYPTKVKRALLSQKGGFLGALLPILATIVTSFIK